MALLRRLPCVSMTPLGFPVVPDVYMTVARLSGPRVCPRRSSSAESGERRAESGERRASERIEFPAGFRNACRPISESRPTTSHLARRNGRQRPQRLSARAAQRRCAAPCRAARRWRRTASNAAIQQLILHLPGGKRGMRRDIDGAGRQDAHVGDEPLDAVFRQQTHAVALGDACHRQGGSASTTADNIPASSRHGRARGAESVTHGRGPDRSACRRCTSARFLSMFSPPVLLFGQPLTVQ